MSRRRAEHASVRGLMGQALAWLVIAAVVLMLGAAVLVPRLAGATPYTVLTGSMRPDMPPGTLVVVKPVDVDDVSVGDVITYQLESGKPAVVTHRVVARGVNLTGTTVLTTRGDANDATDPEPVTPVQVRGERWYSVPWLGHVNNVLTGSERQVAVMAVAGALLAYAALMFLSSVRDAGSKNKRKDTVAS